jgi:hypothetical protein
MTVVGLLLLPSCKPLVAAIPVTPLTIMLNAALILDVIFEESYSRFNTACLASVPFQFC